MKIVNELIWKVGKPHCCWPRLATSAMTLSNYYCMIEFIYIDFSVIQCACFTFSVPLCSSVLDLLMRQHLTSYDISHCNNQMNASLTSLRALSALRTSSRSVSTFCKSPSDSSSLSWSWRESRCLCERSSLRRSFSSENSCMAIFLWLCASLSSFACALSLSFASNRSWMRMKRSYNDVICTEYWSYQRHQVFISRNQFIEFPSLSVCEYCSVYTKMRY